jgi:alanyl-tRNA synthetase
MILAFTFIAAIAVESAMNSCQSPAEKVDDAQANVEDAKQELKDVQKDVNADAVKAANAAEWQAFKTETELKIKNNEIRISELKVKMNKAGNTRDENLSKRIDTLEQKNKDLQVRLDAYEKSQTDWAAFKREFTHDMDELGKALSDLTVDNKK